MGKREMYLTRLEPEGESPPIITKYDSFVFMIYCSVHKKVVITQPRNLNASWMPFVRAGYRKSWAEGAIENAVVVLAGRDKALYKSYKAQLPFDNPLECIQILRYQLPHTLGFVTRVAYQVLVNKNNKKFKCCQDTKRLQWIPIDDAIKGKIDDLWGPEVVSFANTIINKKHQNLYEYSLEEALQFVPREPPRNIEETMLKSIQISEKDVERLFGDFIDHCFPAFYMTMNSFKHYMFKYGFETNAHKLYLLFRSFNYQKTGFLCFHELLLGLVIIEPGTLHGLARARFIFRYYDIDGAGFLNMLEFTRMIKDMNSKIKDPQALEEKIEESKKAIGTKKHDGKEVIGGEDFLKAIGDKRFRGTSQLCRSTKAIFTDILRTIAARGVVKMDSQANIGSIINHNQGVCWTCKSKDYCLSTHSPLLLADGRITDPQGIVEVKTNVDKLTAPIYSVDFVFNTNSAANIILRMIRAFNNVKGTNKCPNGLLSDKPQVLWNLLLALYHDIDLLLSEEDKCPRIGSPVYVVGDIHGNLEDLLSIEKALFIRAPCVGSNFLFLGDYVDRGQWGLECALFLLSFKCIAPNKVTLLRGNHEVRDLQINYTYRMECIKKYGEDIGAKVWELTNKIFDKLPVSAVIDDAIFCAHGGIPKSAKLVSEINKVPRQLKDPENQSAVAWEILWSDPCHPRQFLEVANVTQQNYRDGFIRNSKRGTAYLFSEKGARGFLKGNNLTHIIRAHEVPQRGYQFHFGAMCCTIFSCSHYCGNNNDCAVVLADKNMLRLIRLDTVANAPATD